MPALLGERLVDLRLRYVTPLYEELAERSPGPPLREEGALKAPIGEELLLDEDPAELTRAFVNPARDPVRPRWTASVAATSTGETT